MSELRYVMEAMADDFFPGQFWDEDGNYRLWAAMNEESNNIYAILLNGKLYNGR